MTILEAVLVQSWCSPGGSPSGSLGGSPGENPGSISGGSPGDNPGSSLGGSPGNNLGGSPLVIIPSHSSAALEIVNWRKECKGWVTQLGYSNVPCSI